MVVLATSSVLCRVTLIELVLDATPEPPVHSVVSIGETGI